jgi:hypothetical protein
MLNQAAPVLRKYELIISLTSWESIFAIPFKSGLKFVNGEDAYTVSAQGANLTSRYIKEHVFVTLEVVSDYEYHPITQGSQKRVLQCIKTQPPAREILPLTNNVEINLPLLTVRNTIIDENGEISKEDQKHIAGANKLSYTGTTDISPDK